MPLCEREPIIEIIRPRPAAVSPLSGARPDSVATIDMPNSVKASSSGEPIESSTGRRIGMLMREHDGADQAAGERGGKAGAEGAAGLALARHGVAVDHGRGGADMAGHAEQHRGDEIRRRDHRRHAEQQRERGVFVEVVGERDQHRQADDAVEARQHADREPDQHAEEQDAKPRRLEQEVQRVQRACEHIRLH